MPGIKITKNRKTELYRTKVALRKEIEMLIDGAVNVKNQECKEK